MTSNTVAAELAVRIVAPDLTLVSGVASLSYASEDPYAVRMEFRVGLGEPVPWACARELLSAGLAGREGLGDVTVWPSAGADGSVVLHVELSSPDGRAHIQAPGREISDFLGRTYVLVAAGEEGEHGDLEAELNDLLRGAW